MHYFYLSHPFNGTEAEKTHRATIAAEVTLQFIQQGIAVFSPIVHNHAMFSVPKNKALVDTLPAYERWDMIRFFDLTMLDKAHGMILLKLEGWQNSTGVQAELEYCREHNIPVYEIVADEIDESFYALIKDGK